MYITYAVLDIDGVMYMLDMQCYVPLVLRACCIGGVRYIWCCVHDYSSSVLYMFTSGVVCKW